ncbi:hypothetical protein GCM10022271_09320 [Corallibacter vietnamensis]|uniref:Natural product n=1 Tax=Corallibacter vietnamensis TaxID=904130 RepID=A0ABP7GYJ7_9FLAO
MLKNILNLEGVAVLDKKQQKEIIGGKHHNGVGGGSSGGDGGCTLGNTTSDHQWLVSGGVVVGESCKWYCDGYNAWGGCPLNLPYEPNPYTP